MLPFAGSIDEILRLEEKLSPARQKGLVTILMDLFKKDNPIHTYVKHLMKQGGEPTTVIDFKTKLLRLAVRLEKSYADMEGMGLAKVIPSTNFS